LKFEWIATRGKTTTEDLTLGLLEAKQGAQAVDGQAIAEHNRRSWQCAIGYVPQQIFLAYNMELESSLCERSVPSSLESSNDR